MAELLVKAKSHWKDTWDTKKVAALSVDEKFDYAARAQIGDVIVVRPDKWPWGKEERLPHYIVVKLPGLTLKDAKKYEEQIQEIAYNPLSDRERIRVKRRRRYSVPKATVDAAKQASQTVITVAHPQINGFIASVKDHSL